MQHTCNAAQPVTHTLHTLRLYKQPHLAPPAICCSSPTSGAHGAGASRVRISTKMSARSARSALSSKIATVLSWLHALLEPVLALRELRACATAVDHLGVGVENCSQGVSERPARQLHKLTRGAVRVTVGNMHIAATCHAWSGSGCQAKSIQVDNSHQTAGPCRSSSNCCCITHLSTCETRMRRSVAACQHRMHATPTVHARSSISTARVSANTSARGNCYNWTLVWPHKTSRTSAVCECRTAHFATDTTRHSSGVTRTRLAGQQHRTLSFRRCVISLETHRRTETPRQLELQARCVGRAVAFARPFGWTRAMQLCN